MSEPDAKDVRLYKMGADGVHVSSEGRVLLEPAVSADDHDAAIDQAMDKEQLDAASHNQESVSCANS